jgi:hypothetical protein
VSPEGRLAVYDPACPPKAQTPLPTISRVTAY